VPVTKLLANVPVKLQVPCAFVDVEVRAKVEEPIVPEKSASVSSKLALAIVDVERSSVIG